MVRTALFEAATVMLTRSIDTFEIARALAEAEAPPERFRLRRLLQQALAKLRDRVGAPGLTAEASTEWTRRKPLSHRATLGPPNRRRPPNTLDSN